MKRYHRRLTQVFVLAVLIIPFQNCGGIRSFEPNGSQFSVTESNAIETTLGNSPPEETSANAGNRFGLNTTPNSTSNTTTASTTTINHCDGKYGSSTGKAMFFYQGDYRSIASDAHQLACLMAKYDLVQLTHAFDVKPEREFVEPLPAHALPLKNAGRWNIDVKVLDGAYLDAQGRGIDYVIQKMRSLKPSIQIFAYVPATADHVLGPWNNSMWAQNYLCPKNSLGHYECRDFNAWLNRWHNLYSLERNVWIDGFFVDMVNPFYIHQDTWALQALTIHSLINPATGLPYKIMANTLATEKAYYHSSTDEYRTTLDYKGPMILPEKRPVLFAGQHLKNGDSVLVEGFYIKAGKLNGEETLRTLNDVSELKSKGIGWSAIASEIGYHPNPELVQQGITAQELSNTAAPSARFVSCKWDNFIAAVALFTANGGEYLTYSEANLGTYSGVISTCPVVGI